MLTPQPIMVHCKPCSMHDVPLVHITIADQPPIMLSTSAVRAVAALLAAAADAADTRFGAAQRN